MILESISYLNSLTVSELLDLYDDNIIETFDYNLYYLVENHKIIVKEFT